jgi:hypothetical protein
MPYAQVGLAAAGAVASGLAGAFGLGKDKTPRKNFAQSGLYDKNAFQFGGREGAAQEQAGHLAGLAGAAQGRQAAQAAHAQANYGAADSYQQRALEARASQTQAANMTMARAMGGPLVSQQQAEIDMRRAAAAQASQAASARGAAGLALAGQQAASNTANLQSQISSNAQVNAMQEQRAAELDAFGAFSGLRGADFGAQQHAAQQAQYDAGLQMQQAQYNAGLQMQQRGMNDQHGMALLQQAHDIQRMQYEGQMRGQGLLAGSFDSQQGLEAQRRGANAAQDFKYLQAGMGSVQGAAQSGMSSMKK